MQKLNVVNAKEFAIECFGKLPLLERNFLLLHTQSVIKVLRRLGVVDKRVIAAAWVHDIGKIVSSKNHALHSLKMVMARFKIDKVIKDCILNHGSKSVALTSYGKKMQYADKLSMLLPEMLHFNPAILNKFYHNYLKAKRIVVRDYIATRVLIEIVRNVGEIL